MRALSAAVLVAFLGAVAIFGAPTRGLTRAEIAEAIGFGEADEPRPYLLRHAGRPDNPVIVGAVYTPFLRVALLSRRAVDRGERLRVDDVEPLVTAPVVYIAVRWYCCDPGSTDAEVAVAASEPRILMLPVAPRAPQFVSFMDRRAAVPPVWSRKGTAVLGSFGALPYDDIALVAAFPADVLQAGRPFVIYKEAGGSSSIRTGVVRAADAAAWR